MRIGWLKLHYLLVYAILASLLPYLSLYARERGLSGSEIGWVYGIFGIAVMIAPPIYTALADRFAANRLLIGACYGLGAVALVSLTFAESFFAILAIHLLFAMVFTAMIPLLDGLTFSTINPPVDEAPSVESGTPRTPYRSIRIWGSYGFMIPGLVFPLMLLADLNTLTVSRWAITCGAGFGVIGLASCVALPRYPRLGKGSALPTMAALRALMQREMFVFIVALLTLFMSISVYYTFYSPYLQQLDVPSELIGLITNIGISVEVGCMLISGWLIRRIGVRGVLILGAVSNLLRMLLLASMPFATVGILTQVFHGPTVLALYLIPPMYLNAHATGPFRNSMQGLYAVLCFGLARIIGSAIGGYTIDFFGTSALDGLIAAFWLAAGLGLVAVIVLVGLFPKAGSHAMAGD